MLSCSAVAKGYSVDVVARYLDSKGIKNYMVDIGGELVVKGVNPKEEAWRIGINKPVDDSLSLNQEIQTTLKLTNVGIATSGTIATFTTKMARSMPTPSTHVPDIRFNIIFFQQP